MMIQRIFVLEENMFNLMFKIAKIVLKKNQMKILNLNHS